MKFERHPLSAAWPDMAREDFDALVLSIEAHGLREPITLLDGQVLDGWHRYQACESAGIEVATVEFTGTLEEAAALINDRHTRRNISPGQRAAAALLMYQWRSGSGGQNAKANGNVAVRSAKDIAQEQGISERTVRNAKEAVKADPKALEKIRDGKATATAIVKEHKPAQVVPATVPAEQHAALVQSYEQLAERADDLRIDLESCIDVKDGDPAKALIQVRTVLKSVETRRDELMRECAEHVKTIKWLTRRAEKAEKALEETKATAL